MGGGGPPFQFVADLFFVKIYNNFVSSLLELLIFLAKA